MFKVVQCYLRSNERQNAHKRKPYNLNPFDSQAGGEVEIPMRNAMPSTDYPIL